MPVIHSVNQPHKYPSVLIELSPVEVEALNEVLSHIGGTGPLRKALGELHDTLLDAGIPDSTPADHPEFPFLFKSEERQREHEHFDGISGANLPSLVFRDPDEFYL